MFPIQRKPRCNKSIKNLFMKGIAIVAMILMVCTLSPLPTIQAFSAVHSPSRISVGTIDLNNNSSTASISADGRYIAYASAATNVIPDDINNSADIFLYDTQTNQNTRISVGSNGEEANSSSSDPFISANGRYVVFSSLADNLVADDTNGVQDIFIHDTQSHITTRVSVDSNGVEGNSLSSLASVSSDGKYIAYHSIASNLVADDTNAKADVFLYNTQTAITTRISVDSSGNQGNNLSQKSSISADGDYIAYLSNASNLVADDTNSAGDVFLYDIQSSTTTRISLDSSGNQATGPSPSVINPGWRPSLSSDGRYIAFGSHLTTLVPNDTNGSQDIFVHDTQTGLTTRVSVDDNGIEGNGNSDQPSISPDGNYIAFRSSASNLVTDDTNGWQDIFVYNRATSSIRNISVDSYGVIANNLSDTPSVSTNGEYITFGSAATNLIKYGQDINGPHYTQNIFRHTLSNGETVKASISNVDVEGNLGSESPFISANGEYIVYESLSDNLVHDDTNNEKDIFMYNISNSTTTRISIDSNGGESNGESSHPSISNDGQYVVFESIADNLVANDTNNEKDIFLHNNKTGLTTRISVDNSGNESDGKSRDAHISADGNYITYTSNATNLINGDTNSVSDIFVYNISTTETTRISINNLGIEGNNASYDSSVSADGRYISFTSSANNLVTDDTNNVNDIFVYDNQTGVITKISVSDNGTSENGDSSESFISADGRYVAFNSNASNLIENDTNNVGDIFVYDRQTEITTRVSIDSKGNESDGSSFKPIISDSGRYVIFLSDASNIDMMATLNTGVALGTQQVYVYDRSTESTRLVSAKGYGTNPNNGVLNKGLTFATNSQTVGWATIASDLIDGDSNNASDIYSSSLLLDVDTPTVTNTGITLTGSTGESTINILGTGTINEQIALIIKQYDNNLALQRIDVYQTIIDNIGNRSLSIAINNIDGLVKLIPSLYDTRSNSNTSRRAGPASFYSFSPNIILQADSSQSDQDNSQYTSINQSVSNSRRNGGGGGYATKDNCPHGDSSPSYYDNICDMESINKSSNNGGVKLSAISSAVNTNQHSINKKTSISTSTNNKCYYKNETSFAIETYNDVNGSIYSQDIKELLERCIFHGQNDKQQIFGTNSNITRAEVIKAITRSYMLLPNNFNHFSWEKNGFKSRWQPYRHTLLSYSPTTKKIIQKWGNTDISLDKEASKNDIITLLRTIDPSTYSTLKLSGQAGLSRGRFAHILLQGIKSSELK